MNRRKIIPYKPYLKELARKLRNSSTKTEILLWHELKNKKMKGFDFDRQRPIDDYIVDFYCKDLMLAIEVDGESHIGEEEFDKRRQERLENLGVRFLRFNSMDVFYNLDRVVKEIERWIDNNA
ncbi:MAG: endonuclease domain-containing protein [Ignavibacteriales bacterium]|nr:endonuclease domain-containing protein [Ignavibacteriales bacterium]